MKRVLPLLLALSLAACDDDVILIEPDFSWVDEFFQDPADQVDILMVVDNSYSMLTEQEKLSSEFEAFVEFFYAAQTDYHIGVTTTDLTEAAGRLVGSPNVITPLTPNPAQVFRNNVLVGVEGSGFEKGLEAAAAALGPSLTLGPNAGFYREEAALAIIFVSDEDDGSPFPVDSYLDFFWSLKGQRARDEVRLSALVGVNSITGMPESCGREPDDVFAGADDAPRYWDAVTRSHGVVGSICESDFNDVVSRIGLASSGLRDRFFLTHRPRPSDGIEVVDADFAVRLFIPGTPEFIGDGLLVPPEGTPDGEYPWTYEMSDDEHWIRFTDVESLPPLNTRMLLSYERR